MPSTTGGSPRADPGASTAPSDGSARPTAATTTGSSGRGAASPGPLKIYMSSSTDPYMPQEKTLRLTRALLEEMIERPPGRAGHPEPSHARRARHRPHRGPVGAVRAVGLADGGDRHGPACPASRRTPARRPVGWRPSRPSAPGASPPRPRSARSCRWPTPTAFARRLDAACDRVILDHYLIGDGSPGGWRTRTDRASPSGSSAAGFGEWNDLAKLHEVRDLLAGVLGDGRVLVGCEGFNAV